MSQLIPIINFKTGYDTYDQPEVLPDDGSPELFDMLPFRGVLEKRDGNISLIRPPAFSIINITNAANGVVTTAVNHGYSTGDQVLISGVGGMPQINNPAIQPFTITVTGLNTFQLNISTLAFGAYTVGGTVSRTAYVGPIGITLITSAANGVVSTASNHNLTSGQVVFIQNVQGMTSVNSTTTPYIITVLTPTTFSLNAPTASIPISNITQAPNGVVTTAIEHGFTTGDSIGIGDVLGMVQVNNPAIQPFVITVLDDFNFELNVDTSLFGAYAGGGVCGFAYLSGGGVFQPIQGLKTRQTNTFFKDLIAFNESQAFLFDPTLNEFINISGTTVWTGDDTRFFWSMNYQNSFWATNNIDPIRYYISGTTWTDFRPILFGTTTSNEAHGAIPIGAVAFGPFFLVNTPVIPGTVIINIAASPTPTAAVRLTDNGVGILTSTTAGYSGTVNYITGEVNLVVVADAANTRAVTATYDTEGDRLERGLMIFPYKDRMIVLDTTEGSGLVEQPQRCRYSQNGTVYVEAPVPSGLTFNAQAWRQDIPGRGGFIDAPTEERIISAGFVRDMLIVLFEFSTWRLRYTSNEAIPFVWERVNSQFGAESTYSVIGFDSGILTVGRTGIVISDTNQVRRIDERIPDQVFQITNINNAQRRVQGIRDFQRQVAYWTFPQGDDTRFPNRTLVYNYLENCWTIYRQQFTAFGQFRRDDTLTWGTALNTWGEEDSLWASGDLASGFPVVVAGTRLGEVVFFDRRVTTDFDGPFNFSYLTKKFNPFFAQAMQCKAIYMYLLLAGTSTGQFSIEHYIDESTTVPIATYTVTTSTSGQEKVWRRVQLSACQAQYHQFKFLFSTEQFEDTDISSQDVEIFQILLEVAPAGRLNYGES